MQCGTVTLITGVFGIL